MPFARPLRLALVLASALLPACGDDGGTGTPLDAGPDAPPGTAREVLGTIDVIEGTYLQPDAPPQEHAFATVHGVFWSGRPARWHREVARAGDCVLRRYTPSLCEPACSTGLCVDTNVCEPWPTAVDAGRLTITGLTVPVRITPVSAQYYPAEQLPSELFADGASVNATLVGGGGIPGLSLTAGGVPAIKAQLPQGRLVLQPGRDGTITWTPAAGASRVRLTLNSNNQGHGAPYLGVIECDVDDAAGQITIPAALVDGFPETQAWTVCAGSDCPPSTLRRYHRATFAVGERDIELMVASDYQFGVDHNLPD